MKTKPLPHEFQKLFKSLMGELTRLQKVEEAAKTFLANHSDAGREWCSDCDKTGYMCIDRLEMALETK